MNSTTAFQVSCDAVWFFFFFLSCQPNKQNAPSRRRHKSFHTRSDMQFTPNLCQRYQTGESTMTPTQWEPEQKHYRREISQACRIDLLDSGVWAEQWELGEVSLSSPLSPLPPFCKSQHVPPNKRKDDFTGTEERINKSRSQKWHFPFEYKSISWV